jgi:hypothetical protein
VFVPSCLNFPFALSALEEEVRALYSNPFSVHPQECTKLKAASIQSSMYGSMLVEFC